jgi:FdhD protein
MDRRTERTVVTHVSNSSAGLEPRRRTDHLVVEEPLSIRLDGTLVATTMRTPGDDLELAAGLCFTDGLLAGAPLAAVRHCSDPSGPLQIGRHVEAPGGNVVSVDTGGRAPRPSPRLGNVSSSCGWCGNDQLDAMCARLDPLPPVDPFDLDVLRAIPDAVTALQPLFGRTGSVHAAAAFDRNGEILVVREDVGRHNAVDKVVGSFLLADDGPVGVDGGPTNGLGLFVSGRASIEMVQKAWAAGFCVLLAVSAPTALAVRAAQLANLMLVGFVRTDGFNVYAPELP